MFGSKKKQADEDKKIGEEFGQRFVEMVKDDMQRYRSRVIYWAASDWLGTLARSVSELGHGLPDDEAYCRKRLDLLVGFAAWTKEEIKPFREQLLQHVLKTYSAIWDESPDLKQLATQWVDDAIRSERETIAEAAAYVVGISSSYVKELTAKGASPT